MTGDDWLRTVSGGVVGFVLAQAVTYVYRRKRLRAHWAALGVEIDLCADGAWMYLNHGIRAPLYRLPLAALQQSYPALLHEGAIASEESRALTEFRSMVEQINRGLDQADRYRDPEKADRLNEEVGRLDLKCRQLVRPDQGEPLVTAARAAVAPHCQTWQERLEDRRRRAFLQEE